jgi:hypothetical protein
LKCVERKEFMHNNILDQKICKLFFTYSFR